MKRIPPPVQTARAAQRGAALIMGLIFLTVLTVIGVTATRMSTLEERMAGNQRDRSLAEQAAELALRDAERDILGEGAFPRSPGISGLTGFDDACDGDNTSVEDNGLCYNGTGGYGTPIWTTVDMTGSPSVEYGLFSTRTSAGATSPDSSKAIPLVSAQPRYLIEGFRKNISGSSERFYYRITVRAVGANANTVVWLQEVFTP